MDMSADQTTYLKSNQKKSTTFQEFNYFLKYFNLFLNLNKGKNVLALGDLDMSEISLLLDIEESDSIRISEQKHSSSGVENFLAVWKLNLLGQLVFQILNDQLEKQK